MKYLAPFRWMFTWWECAFLLALLIASGFVDDDLMGRMW